MRKKERTLPCPSFKRAWLAKGAGDRSFFVPRNRRKKNLVNKVKTQIANQSKLIYESIINE